jgi:hypothetical protein
MLTNSIYNVFPDEIEQLTSEPFSVLEPDSCLRRYQISRLIKSVSDVGQEGIFSAARHVVWTGNRSGGVVNQGVGARG